MQSKQQKQIKVFLIQTFGGSRGGSLFSRQEKILDRLIKTAANRSKNQMKTLVETYDLHPTTNPQQDLDAILGRG